MSGMVKGKLAIERPAKLKRQLPLHLMLLPALIVTAIYAYGPMVGLLMAFQKYVPSKGLLGSEWVGLENFRRLFTMDDSWQLVYNTFVISIMKAVLNQFVPIVLALLLNEIVNKRAKRAVQTILYIPYFLSWVILGGVLRDFLSQNGYVNQILKTLNIKPMLFLGDKNIFRYTLVFTDLWQNAGFGTIVFLAAITNVNPVLYEAATIDGANRFRLGWNITLPAMRPIIILTTTLALGNIFNAGFDQVFMLYNAAVMETGDIIDTFVYRMGLINQQYSLATAVGLLKSLVSITLISFSYYLAYRFSNYRIF